MSRREVGRAGSRFDFLTFSVSEGELVNWSCHAMIELVRREAACKLLLAMSCIVWRYSCEAGACWPSQVETLSSELCWTFTDLLLLQRAQKNSAATDSRYHLHVMQHVQLAVLSQ